jgi:hypothetical protein
MSKINPKIEDAAYQKVAQEVQRNELQPALMAKAIQLEQRV